MKVLLVGGGGREHALGWKIAASPRLDTLFLAPGNPGLDGLGTPIGIGSDDIDALVGFADENTVDLVVVGPEAPLAAGLADALGARGIACFGASQAAAQLETSKAFMKDVAASAGVPTARHGVFTEPASAYAFLTSLTPPFVIKADGLAAGKGVVIAQTRAEAEEAINAMFAGRFGEAGARVLIEEFMTGEEASFFVITDGTDFVALPAAQDHKRALDGDQGPNTGGMGAYAPAPIFTETVRQRTIDTIIVPTLAEMRRRAMPYRGVLYAGLMIENEVPRLVEFNARFGDPECQALMRLIDGDILPLLMAAGRGALGDQSVSVTDEAVALIVLAARGYPDAYEKGETITGIADAEAGAGIVVFHAGTKQVDGALVSHGGRVLNITATGPDIRTAVDRAYAAAAKINWPGGRYRRDIAWRAL